MKHRPVIAVRPLGRLLTRQTLAPTTIRRTVAAFSAAIVLLLGVGAGAAYAYWTGTGSGHSTVSVAGPPATIHVIAATATPSSRLIPGGTADLTLTLDNSQNAYSVKITAISQSGGVHVVSGGGCTDDPSWPGTLGNSGISVSSSQSSLPYTVNASSGAFVVHLNAGATMTTGSASACQGKTFQIPVTVTVQR